jgi:phosphohistidine swiveling domain-containing protein
MVVALRDSVTDTPAALLLDGGVDPGLLGGKAASLDRLVAWGLPVPPSGAVTTEAYRRFAGQPEIVSLLDRIRGGEAVTAAEVDAVFGRGRFADDDAAAILTAARTVAGGRPLAIRSSATVEDLDRSSFAGQYHSVLGVDAADPEAVLDAVRLVFASLWHPAPRAYRSGFGIDDDSAAMAVVLMAMVPAERAGVAFTVDPTGADDSARVEFVEGLGESLVSGQTTPAAVVLPRVGTPVGVPVEVGEALALALEIERRAGRPQDVEWAWDGERTWIVQARPITVVEAVDGDGFDDPVDVIAQLDLTTAGIGEMLPGVLPPLVWGVSSLLVEEAFRRLLDDLAVLPPDLVGARAVVRRVEGRAAMDFGRIQAMAGALPGSAGEELEAEYFGSRRSGRPAAGTGSPSLGRLRSAAHDLRVVRSRHRYATDAELLHRAVTEIVDDPMELESLDDRGLVAYELRLLDLAARGTAAELGVSADATATFRRLQLMLARHVGAVDAGRLADRVVVGVGVTVPLGPGSSAAVFSGPTWEELGRPVPERADPMSPEDVEGLFAERVTEVRGALRERPSWHDDSVMARLRMRAIRRLAREAAARLRGREQAKAALLALGGEVRRVHLEAGRRLLARGALGDPAEVDLLSPAELFGRLRGRTDHDVSPDVIAHRRRWQLRYGQEGPLPPRFTGVPTRSPLEHRTGQRHEGWAASPGRFRGRAVVVTSPDDDLPPDAVLVAEATDPSWSPLFLRAGALVLDRGGPLSHAAILARELGLPAVLNVADATGLLAGHDVTVDGDAGVVVVHDPDGPADSEADAP